MSNFGVVIGLIGVVFIFSLIVAAYTPIFGSAASDAQANNVSNSSHTVAYQQSTQMAQGFMGLTEAQVFVLLIILVAVTLVLIFTF
jgi:hypothetical protein